MKKTLIVLLSFLSFSTFGWSPLGHTVPRIQEALHQIGESQFEVVRSQEISILVWNTHKENYESHWQEEYKKLKQGIDFVMLQEAIGKIGQDYPDIYDGYEGVVGESFHYNGMKTGNLTLSPYHAQTRKLLHSPVREPIINTPKPVILTTYNLEDGRRLMLVNIHGINFVSYRKFKKHIKQVMSNIKSHSGPLVWAGDFNTWSKRRTKYMNKILPRIGLKKVSFRNSHRVKKFHGKPLDHFFVRGLEVIDANFPVVHSSDHNAMIVHLRL